MGGVTRPYDRREKSMIGSGLEPPERRGNVDEQALKIDTPVRNKEWELLLHMAAS